jgi:hypothetical protein
VPNGLPGILCPTGRKADDELVLSIYWQSPCFISYCVCLFGVNALNPTTIHRLVWLAVALFAFASAHAEVLELEGIVKAVDADDRTITIERKTAKGAKTLELEVAKKAGNLASVKVGDTISFGYDPDLEIVTKIGGQGESDEPTSDGDKPEAKTISRLSVEISSRGGLSVRLEQVPDAPFSDAPGIKADLSGLSAAKVRNDEGFFSIDLECDKPETVAALGEEGLRIRRESLVVDTSVGKDNIGQRNFLSVKRLFGLPFTIQIDNASQGTTTRESPSHGGCSLNYNFRITNRSGQQNAHVFISLQPTDSLFSEGKVLVSLGKPNEQLKQVAQREIKDGAAEMRVEIPGVTGQDKLNWWCVVRGEPVVIERVRIASPLMASLGVQLDGVAGQVSVKQVFENGAAEKAGLKEGDILLSVNGQRVRDAESAVEAISSSTIGEEVTLKIKRNGKESVLKAKAG